MSLKAFSVNRPRLPGVQPAVLSVRARFRLRGRPAVRARDPRHQLPVRIDPPQRARVAHFQGRAHPARHHRRRLPGGAGDQHLARPVRHHGHQQHHRPSRRGVERRRQCTHPRASDPRRRCGDRRRAVHHHRVQRPVAFPDHRHRAAAGDGPADRLCVSVVRAEIPGRPECEDGGGAVHSAQYRRNQKCLWGVGCEGSAVHRGDGCRARRSAQ